MARPRLPIGTYGTINVDQIGDQKFRARTRYRFQDGKSRQVERFGPTGPKAKNLLKAALTTIESDRGGELRPATTLRVLADRFIAAKHDVGRSAGTLETYGSAIKFHIKPKIGDMSVAEATPERLQKFLTRVEKENGPGAAKNCRSTLSGMMGLAVRNGAAPLNPVRELERITHRRKKGSKPIPLNELPAFLEKVRSDPELITSDTVELIEFMLLVGWRVAEVCALDLGSVDFDSKTAKVEAIAKRLKGQGVIRQEFAKTEGSERLTPLPRAAFDLLARRRDRLAGMTTLLFPTPLMRMRDPSNTQRQIRERRDALGYPDLSTHSFRKTCATLLDDDGLSAREIAEYLGHENPSMTQDVYLAKTTGSKKAAAAVQNRMSDLFDNAG